jgi:hypothetical protein
VKAGDQEETAFVGANASGDERLLAELRQIKEELQTGERLVLLVPVLEHVPAEFKRLGEALRRADLSFEVMSATNLVAVHLAVEFAWGNGVNDVTSDRALTGTETGTPDESWQMAGERRRFITTRVRLGGKHFAAFIPGTLGYTLYQLQHPTETAFYGLTDSDLGEPLTGKEIVFMVFADGVKLVRQYRLAWR